MAINVNKAVFRLTTIVKIRIAAAQAQATIFG